MTMNMVMRLTYRVAGMRAAVYLRISPKPFVDRDEEDLAIARQRAECRALCDAKGWTPVEYVDNLISATKGVRPAYRRMLSDIRAGNLDAVVTWDLDRLHRRPIELEEFMALADGKQLALATVTGDVDLSTDNGRLFARIKAAVARAEVERKSARQKSATRQRVAAGRPWSSVRPFGFERDLVTHRPAEADVLRGLYRDVNAGVGLMALARQLNEQGVTTTKGGRWQHQTLRQTLTRPRYAGLVEHDGREIGPGTWEAIVPEQVWRSAVARLTANKRPGRPPKGLLSAIAVCGVCGHTVGRANGNGRPSYVCALVKPDGHAAKHVTRRADYTDERVITAVLERLAEPDARELLVRRDDDTPALRAEADTLRTRLEQVAADYADGDLTSREWKVARDRIKARLADVEDQVSDASAVSLLAPLIDADDPRAVWDRLGLDWCRGVVETLCTVTIDPTGRGSVFRPEHVRVDFTRSVPRPSA